MTPSEAVEYFIDKAGCVRVPVSESGSEYSAAVLLDPDPAVCRRRLDGFVSRVIRSIGAVRDAPRLCVAAEMNRVTQQYSVVVTCGVTE